MRTVEVTHAAGRYEVRLGAGLLGRVREWTEALLPGHRVAVVTDAVVGALYGREGGPAGIETSWPSAWLEVAPGEARKTRGTWAALSDRLLELAFGRDSVIVALGGGVIGDLAGFVAATYLRGIPVVQVPTTLLAMLDASVGGKTGVDTAHGKNLIGAFHPPALVVADPAVLQTLPEREFRAGFAEAVKHGLIADAAYFHWIGAHAPALLAREPEALTHLVARSVEIKAAIVSADEREGGQRAVLNAGHTIAHALEHASGLTLLHGEAVALGLVAECEIAEQLGLCAPGVTAEVLSLLTALGLPVQAPTLDMRDVLAATARDKKTLGGTVRLALPATLGAMEMAGGRWTVGVQDADLRAGLAAIRLGQAR